MLEQDYLMRILLQFAEIIRRSWTKADKDRDPRRAADMLEDAIGNATDLDGGTLLSLSPDSIASVMQVSGVDPRVTEYIAFSLLLAAGYLREAGEFDLADLREQQARAVADAYGIDLPDDPEAAARLFGEADSDLAAEAESTIALMGYEAPPEDVAPLVEQAHPEQDPSGSDPSERR